jgi:type 1 glutamine amidotransferase
MRLLSPLAAAAVLLLLLELLLLVPSWCVTSIDFEQDVCTTAGVETGMGCVGLCGVVWGCVGSSVNLVAKE